MGITRELTTTVKYHTKWMQHLNIATNVYLFLEDWKSISYLPYLRDALVSSVLTTSQLRTNLLNM